MCVTMAFADFCRCIRQISPGNALSPSRLCPPHLRPRFPCRYRTLKIIAFSSSVYASYVFPVRRTSVLPAASFGFCLTTDTLAVRLTIPPAGVVGDFHPQVSAPCRAHNKKADSERTGLQDSSNCRISDLHNFLFFYPDQSVDFLDVFVGHFLYIRLTSFSVVFRKMLRFLRFL